MAIMHADDMTGIYAMQVQHLYVGRRVNARYMFELRTFDAARPEHLAGCVMYARFVSVSLRVRLRA